MKMKLNEEIDSKFEVMEIQNKIVELQDYIFVNHYGTIISSSPLSKGLITENDYNFTGEYKTLRDYYPQIDM